MKTIIAAIAISLVAQSAVAGNVGAPKLDPEVIEAEATSHSADIVVPIMLLLILIAVVTTGSKAVVPVAPV